MKQGIIVSNENLAMIFGRVKNSLNGKSWMATRNIYTNKIKKANRLLKSHSTWNFVEENGELMMSKKAGHEFSRNSIKIERSVVDSQKKFIAVRDPQGTGCIINVGDKISITSQGIFLFKKEPYVNGYQSHIEAWQFD
jgi:hypothetical protein